MERDENLTINQANYELPGGGRGKIAVIMYTGTSDPTEILDNAVFQFVGGKPYHELIDANLDNPWMRVILSDINQMSQEIFDPVIHQL